MEATVLRDDLLTHKNIRRIFLKSPDILYNLILHSLNPNAALASCGMETAFGAPSAWEAHALIS